MIPPEVGHRVRRLLELAARGEAGERELADAEITRVLARHGATMRRLGGEEARFTAGLLYETHDVLVVPLNHGEQVELVLLGAPADLADAVAAHRVLSDWMHSAWEREQAASNTTRPPWSPIPMVTLTFGGMGALLAQIMPPPRMEDRHRRSFYLGLGQRLFERLEDQRLAEGRPEKPVPFEDEPVREEQRADQEGTARPAAAPSADPPAPAPPRGPPLRPPPPDPDVERGRRDAAAEIRAKRHAAEQGYSVGAGVPLAWARPLPRLPLALPPHVGG
mgnify:CR=1 FL=1